MRFFFLLIMMLLTLQNSIGSSAFSGSKMVSSISEKIWIYGQSHRSLSSVGKVVLIGGCFDVFHFGHLTFIEQAKKQGDYLIIALESDEAIETYKKRKKIHTAEQRALILASLIQVDEVVILPKLKGYDDYLQLVKTIHPDIIAVTEGDPQIENKVKQMTSIGGKVVVVTSLLPNLSTSSIISRSSCQSGTSK